MSPGPLKDSNFFQRDPFMGTGTVEWASGNERALLRRRQAGVDVFGVGALMNRQIR
jgi:hypothetical protein